MRSARRDRTCLQSQYTETEIKGLWIWGQHGFHSKTLVRNQNERNREQGGRKIKREKGRGKEKGKKGTEGWRRKGGLNKKKQKYCFLPALQKTAIHRPPLHLLSTHRPHPLYPPTPSHLLSYTTHFPILPYQFLLNWNPLTIPFGNKDIRSLKPHITSAILISKKSKIFKL